MIRRLWFSRKHEVEPRTIHRLRSILHCPKITIELEALIQPSVVLLKGVSIALSAVAKDLGGIAFHSVARGRPSGVKVVPLTTNGTTLDPFSPQAVEAGYPLFRPVHVVAAVDEPGAFDPVIDQFVRYVLSRDGQLDLIKDGYFPLSQQQLHRQAIKLGWEVLK